MGGCLTKSSFTVNRGSENALKSIQPFLFSKIDAETVLQDSVVGDYLMYRDHDTDRIILSIRYPNYIYHRRITELNDLFYLDGQPYPYLDSIILYHRKHKLNGIKLNKQAQLSARIVRIFAHKVTNTNGNHIAFHANGGGPHSNGGLHLGSNGGLHLGSHGHDIGSISQDTTSPQNSDGSASDTNANPVQRSTSFLYTNDPSSKNNGNQPKRSASFLYTNDISSKNSGNQPNRSTSFLYTNDMSSKNSGNQPNRSTSFLYTNDLSSKNNGNQPNRSTSFLYANDMTSKNSGNEPKRSTSFLYASDMSSKANGNQPKRSTSFLYTNDMSSKNNGNQPNRSTSFIYAYDMPSKDSKNVSSKYKANSSPNTPLRNVTPLHLNASALRSDNSHLNEIISTHLIDGSASSGYEPGSLLNNNFYLKPKIHSAPSTPHKNTIPSNENIKASTLVSSRNWNATLFSENYGPSYNSCLQPKDSVLSHRQHGDGQRKESPLTKNNNPPRLRGDAQGTSHKSKTSSDGHAMSPSHSNQKPISIVSTFGSNVIESHRL